jgi:hypothetical protein
MPGQLICPKCKSTNVSNNLSSMAVATGTFLNEHKCNSCGYVGIFPEVEVEKQKLISKRKK